MRRRDFVTVIAGSALGWPCATQSQQRIRRIGVLWHAGNEEQEGEYFASLLEGFRDLGYVDGRTIRFEHRYANEQYERFRTLAAELITLDIDVFVAVTRLGAAAAQAATQSIPIVFVVVPDPVANKFVDSLARPGGNMTGLAQLTVDITEKRLEILKEALPGIRRVALLYNPSDSASSRRTVESVTKAADSLRISIRPYEARIPEEIDHAFSLMARDGNEAVFVAIDSMLFNQRHRVAERALAHRLPAMLTNRPGTQAGGLLSYGQDTRLSFRRVAYYVDKIFKGAKPAELPVEQPTKFELLINLKTARALRIVIPPALLARADEVIE